MQIELSTLISIISVSAAVVFGYIAMKRNDTKDIEDDVEGRVTQITRVITKLDSISESLNEIRRDNKDLRTDLNKLSERVVILEQRNLICLSHHANEENISGRE